MPKKSFCAVVARIEVENLEDASLVGAKAATWEVVARRVAKAAEIFMVAVYSTEEEVTVFITITMFVFVSPKYSCSFSQRSPLLGSWWFDE